MKTFFALIVILFLSLNLLSETKTTDAKKITLSYAIPSKLNWKQATGDDSIDDMQVYTMEDTEGLRLTSMQIENTALWKSISTMDKEKIFNELTDGKKEVHSLIGVTHWTAEKNLQKKSDKEIIFEITGSYTKNSEKKYFSEKYYMTPVGFILMTLDWTEKSDAGLVKKAKSEFKNIAFKSETK